MKKFWIIVVTAVSTVVVVLVLLGWLTWEWLGSIPVLGGMARGMIKRKAKKALSIEPDKPKPVINDETMVYHHGRLVKKADLDSGKKVI